VYRKFTSVIVLAILFLTLTSGCISVTFETHAGTENNVEISFETPVSSEEITVIPATVTSTNTVPSTSATLQVTPQGSIQPTTQVPSLPTPQGKLVFDENFDDGFASGITTTSTRWEIIDDNNDGKLFQINNSLGGGDWVDIGLILTTIADGTIEYKVNLVDYSNSSGAIACNFRHTAKERYVLSLVANTNNISINYQGIDDIWRSLDNALTFYDFKKKTWYDVRIDFKGNEIIAYLDSKKVLTATDDRLKTGGITFTVAPTTVAQFDDIRVWTQP